MAGHAHRRLCGPAFKNFSSVFSPPVVGTVKYQPIGPSATSADTIITTSRVGPQFWVTPRPAPLAPADTASKLLFRQTSAFSPRGQRPSPPHFGGRVHTWMNPLRGERLVPARTAESSSVSGWRVRQAHLRDLCPAGRGPGEATVTAWGRLAAVRPHSNRTTRSRTPRLSRSPSSGETSAGMRLRTPPGHARLAPVHPLRSLTGPCRDGGPQ